MVQLWLQHLCQHKHIDLARSFRIGVWYQVNKEKKTREHDYNITCTKSVDLISES
jgi:hypothetical protein